MTDEKNLEQLTTLRQTIHQNPELSGKEKQTANRIYEYLKSFKPDELITNLGGHGLAAVFNGKSPGPTVMLRAELDALPIQEKNKSPYQSQFPNVSHKCGHDGHMTMVAGVAPFLQQNRPEKGRVILLFQPAEETGQGAYAVLQDPQFEKIKPDYVFALHNIPGEPLGKVLLKQGTFAAASAGMKVGLEGATAHAAHPHDGINPAFAMGDLVERFRNLENDTQKFREFVLATIIHLRVGQEAFGTSPGEGEFMTTLRAFSNEDMEVLFEEAEAIAKDVAQKHRLGHKIAYQEVFPATTNDDVCYEQISEVVKKAGLESRVMEAPFRWSEDFGHFSQRFKTGFFGLGSGEQQPPLHNEHYDFPDQLLAHGINIYQQLIQRNLS